MFYKKDVGKKGEISAEKYLKKKGYLFIARNYWTSDGEIDLIFYKNFKLIFVEVKTRSNNIFGTGRESVDAQKQNHIKKVSKDFIKSHCVKGKVPFYICKIQLKLKFFKVRYDVIEVSANNDYKINSHLKGYFK